MRRIMSVAFALVLAVSFLASPQPAAAGATLGPWTPQTTQVTVGTTSVVGAVSFSNHSFYSDDVLTVTGVSIDGADGADFSVNQDGCTGVSLGIWLPSTSCSVTIAFSPTRLGLETATISFAYTSTRSGEGTVQGAIDAIGGPIGTLCGFEGYPRTVAYGDTHVGQTSWLGEFDRLAISNCGPVDLNVTDVALSGPDADDFVLGPDTCVGTYPATDMPFWQRCYVGLAFQPQSPGAKEATVTVHSDGANAPQVLTLTGVAIPAADLGVTLTALPDPDPAERGGLVTYTITVVNHGPSTSQQSWVAWGFSFPGTFESVPAGAMCDPFPWGPGMACRRDLADLDVGATITISATARVGTSGVPGELVAYAQLGGSGTADLGYDNNSANVMTSVADTEPPTVRFDYNESPYGLEQWVSISCVAEDNAGIDWTRTTCPTLSGPAYAFDLGAQTFSATAYDLAGYRADLSTTLVVTTDYVSMKTLTGQWVTKPSVSKELLRLLD